MPSVPYLNVFGRWTASRTQRGLPAHQDPALEIILVVRGEVEFRFPDHSRMAGAGDISWTWPWERHEGGRGITTSEIYWIQIRLDRLYRKRPLECPSIHPTLEREPGEGRSWLEGLWNIPDGCMESRVGLRRLIPDLVKRLQAPTGFQDAWIWNQTRQLLIELAECSMEHGEQSEESPAKDRVRQWVDALPEVLSDPWTLEDMAEACALGRTQFARHFAEVTGETPLRHLNRLRIEEAKRQLQEDRKTVTDIAFDCGFGSSQHFSRVFRQYTGAPPREYRDANICNFNQK